MANQRSWQGKSALQRRLTSHRSKGPSWKSGKSRYAGQAMEKWEPCYADGRNVSRQRPLWRSVWCFQKHLKNRATEHRALPLKGILLGKTKHRQDTSTPKFRAALFTRISTSVHVKYPRKEKNEYRSCGSYVQCNITQPWNQCHKPSSSIMSGFRYDDTKSNKSHRKRDLS